METLKRFRIITVQLTLLLTAAAAAICYAFVNFPAAIGLLMGGIASALSFWVLAVRLDKVAALGAAKVKWTTYKWTVARLMLYTAVFAKAYTLDRETLTGFLGAVGGVLIAQIALVFLGFTGLDQKKE